MKILPEQDCVRLGNGRGTAVQGLRHLGISPKHLTLPAIESMMSLADMLAPHTIQIPRLADKQTPYGDWLGGGVII